MDERWLPVEGWENYEVSDHGYVRRVGATKPLAPLTIRGGYQQVALWRDGRRRLLYVHRLVARAFIGPCPTGMQVNHKDGNPRYNRDTNVEYVTRSQNIRHAIATHGSFRGERHSQAKFTERDVQMIRLLSARLGLTQEEIAARYAVSTSTVGYIVNKKRWAHVPDLCI